MKPVEVPLDGDYVDRILEQWRRERPDLDMSPIGIVGRIYRLARILEKHLNQSYEMFGLSRGGFDVLAALRRAGPPYLLSPTNLHGTLLITSGAVTNRIDRLEERGLVIRQADPEDRRALRVGLTPEGKNLVDTVVARIIAAEHALLASMGPAQREALAELLRQLSIGLQDTTAAADLLEQSPSGSVG